MTLWGEEEVETRICIHCNEEKPLHEMELERPATQSYRNECLKCRRTIARERNNLKKEYITLMPSMKDECIICQRKGEDIQNRTSYKKKKQSVWVLDHCHDTNQFRGWICNSCNNGLGGFNDDVKRLERAVEYLKGRLRNESHRNPQNPTIPHKQ